MLFFESGCQLVGNRTKKTWGKYSRCLESTAAQRLFRWLPAEITYNLAKAFSEKNPKGNEAKQVLDHLLMHSKIYREVFANPGGGEIFHYLYTKESDNPVDRYFIDCPCGHQIYERLKTLQTEIPKLLRSRLADHEKITVDNIGSGQGYDMIHILRDNPDLRKRVHVGICQ